MYGNANLRATVWTPEHAAQVGRPGTPRGSNGRSLGLGIPITVTLTLILAKLLQL